MLLATLGLEPSASQPSLPLPPWFLYEKKVELEDTKAASAVLRLKFDQRSIVEENATE